MVNKLTIISFIYLFINALEFKIGLKIVCFILKREMVVWLTNVNK
jgi:hypothetical protein